MIPEHLSAAGAIPRTDRRGLITLFAGAGGAAAAGSLLSACAGAKPSGSDGVGNFPSTPAWKFVFVNHALTNPFFGPTRTALADAAALLNLPAPQWTGSQDGTVAEMVAAFGKAIDSRAAGIAVPLIDNAAFVEPTKRALAEGIPVIAYNATAPGNYPLAYIGQDLYRSGMLMGQRIAQTVTAGTVLVGIAQPGANNLQPRLDGLTAALAEAAPGVAVKSVDTGAAQSNALRVMTSAYADRPDAVGLYAVDAGTTASIAQLIANRNIAGRVHAGGFDTLADTIAGIASGALEFTIDQSPYMQGFLSVLYLYLYRVSGTLLAPPQTDTGLTFVTRENAASYDSGSAYEGRQGHDLGTMPASIPLPQPSTATL